jgi:GMP synthase (glutamine-hydrolysing)
MIIHYVQHVPFETPGEITAWATREGHVVTANRVFEGEPIPEADRYDWLVVMGGPMGVGDESRYDWLTGEKRAIASAIEHGKTVVGVCLGAQLIAAVLGARVYPNATKEIGWFPVTRTKSGETHMLTRDLPGQFFAFHWHGDTFDLPAGADHLVRSEACENQMFACDGGRVVGIQFHLEMTDQGIAALVENCRGDIVSGPHVQSPDQMLGAKSLLHDAHAILHSLLDRLSL